MKLTRAGALSALEEVERDGMLWKYRSYEVPQIWASLKRRGWVELNPWSGRYQPSPAGRLALDQDRQDGRGR